MLYRSLERWERPEDQELLVFFAQRMDELSFQYTLDSHRPPTATPPTLARECLEALKYAQKNAKALPGAIHLFEELEARLRGNSVAAGLLEINIDKYFEVDRTNPAVLIKTIEVLQGEIRQYPYAVECFDRILSLIDSGNSTEKSELDFLCRELVSSLANLNVSTQWINHVTVSTFFGEQKISLDFDLRSYFKNIFPHEHSFTVMIPISSKAHLVDDDYLKAFSAKITELENVKEYKEEISTLCGSFFERVLVLNSFPAKDPHSAVEKAKERVDRIHHIFGLFNHKHKLKIGDDSLVIQKCCRKDAAPYSTSLNRMHFVRDQLPKPAARSMERMMRTVRLPRGSDKKKFFNAVSFHGLSSGSTATENQLVNIWTALETITPESYSGSTISNVASGVLPFIGLNYITRLVRCLLGDLLRWDRKITVRLIKEAKSEDDADLLQRLFCLLSLPENEEILGKLLAEMKDFFLLRHRTYSLHKALKSLKKIRDAVLGHQRRVEWQIHRIYRTRNSIVHSGQLPSFTQHLISNAHDYFDQVFELSCELCSGDQGYDRYETCFNYASLRYDEYIQSLDSDKKMSVADAKRVLWLPPKSTNKKAVLPG